MRAAAWPNGRAVARRSGPGESVTLTVEFQGKTSHTFHTAADASGRWDIGGLKSTMNQGPFVLTLSSMGATATANDVWFGTVLLCTGQVSRPARPSCLPPAACRLASLAAAQQEVQTMRLRCVHAASQSNMELNMHPIYNNDSLIAGATTPEIRLFQVPVDVSLDPLPVGTPVATKCAAATSVLQAQYPRAE